MIKIILTLILILIFFILGNFIPALKKLINLIVSNFLKLLSLFGIKIKKREQTLNVSPQFKETYKEIKIVKLANKNIKSISYIDWTSLTILLISGTLFLINFFTKCVISNWLFNIIKNLKFIKTPTDMNTIFTAMLFSIMSFALSSLLARWKETKQQRIEHKQLKLKQEAIKLMSSKELLDQARLKDEQNYKELKY